MLADIGGTNTRLALALGGKLSPTSVQRLKNEEFGSFEALLSAYLATQNDITFPTFAGAAVALAGPVENGTGVMTNLKWRVERECLTRLTGTKNILILNDLQAQGYALAHLDPADTVPILSKGPATKDATKLVVGLGTGFNAAVVFALPGGQFVPPSEAGHTDLPVRSKTERELAAYVAHDGAGAAIEDLLSGRGLGRAYGFFAGTAKDAPPADPAWVIEAAKVGTDRHAVQALRIFIRLLARTVADLALIHLAHGGIYLVGGVARAVTPFLQDHGFEQAFHDKGRFADFLTDFSVTLVRDDFAALKGCLQALAEHGDTGRSS
ncbi:MAG: ROK family protein [Rhodobacteraceae bacterium]|nr:ROK family protein [Paracoccaceae bacterium]